MKNQELCELIVVGFDLRHGLRNSSGVSQEAITFWDKIVDDGLNVALQRLGAELVVEKGFTLPSRPAVPSPRPSTPTPLTEEVVTESAEAKAEKRALTSAERRTLERAVRAALLEGSLGFTTLVENVPGLWKRDKSWMYAFLRDLKERKFLRVMKAQDGKNLYSLTAQGARGLQRAAVKPVSEASPSSPPLPSGGRIQVRHYVGARVLERLRGQAPATANDLLLWLQSGEPERFKSMSSRHLRHILGEMVKASLLEKAEKFHGGKAHVYSITHRGLVAANSKAPMHNFY